MIAGKDYQKEISDLALDSLRLRGPDSLKQAKANFYTAAFARLSIIEPLVERQPLELEKGRLLVCNGEIYNFKELASTYLSELEDLSISSDIAVLGELIKRFGNTSFLSELIGMFSFVVIDQNTQSVMAARDFVGEKPLYYSPSLNGIILSSSLKAIAIQLGRVTVDPIELETWLTYGVFSPGKTLYKEIQEVPSGSQLFWNNEGIKIENYWKWPEKVTNESKNSSRVLEMKSELLKNIDLITQSDVGYALAVSSGLDSRLLLNMFKEVKSLTKITLLNVLMQDRTFVEEIDESDKLFQDDTKPKVRKILFDKNEISKWLPEFLAKLDSPCSDPAIIVVNFIARNIQSEYKVIITGDGGDELFKGYEIFRYYKYLMFSFPILKILLTKPVRKVIIELIARLPDQEYMSWKQKLLRLLTSLGGGRSMFTANSISPNFLWKHLNQNKTIEPTCSIANEQELEKYLQEVNLPQLFLQKVDRGSMCEGVEFRSYFLLRNTIEASKYLSNEIDRRSLYYNLTGDSYFEKKQRKHGLGVPLTTLLECLSMPVNALSQIGVEPKTIQYISDKRTLNPGFANINWSLLTLGYHLESLNQLGIRVEK